MIWEMLCNFIIKDVIQPDGAFYYGPLWNCYNGDYDMCRKFKLDVHVYIYVRLHYCELLMICEAVLQTCDDMWGSIVKLWYVMICLCWVLVL
jgi:hypothetical protein